MAIFKHQDVFAGRYMLVELIGEGGFSEVWKAQDQMADDAVVALKIYAPEKGLDDYGVRQFRKEFSLTHHLAHPHLMKVYHFDISDGSPYLIMPFCAYGSLARVLAEDGPLGERQIALLMCQVGSALEELHSQDSPILHQDIKPDNILVFHPESFLLADFGISSQIRHTLRKSTSSLKSLTIAYAPPERFDARNPVSDASSDIFSLGVTLYEMCTNRIPWDGYGGQSLLKGGHVPYLPDTFSAELNKILQACMSVDRSKRPSATELHVRGRHFLETGQWLLPKNEKAKKGFISLSLTTLLVTAAIVLIINNGSWWYYHSKTSAQEGYPQKTASTLPLEERIRELEQKGTLLEKDKQDLLQRDSINKVLLMDKEGLIATYEGKLKVKKAAITPARSPKPKAVTVATESIVFFSNEELQKYLNRISNPDIESHLRSSWKSKTLTQFADGAVKVQDLTTATTKEYSADIFLNHLIDVPYRILITDVKRDQNNKITELKLHMEPKI